MTLLSDDRVRFLALRAAAKVALTMSTASIFAGCGGSVSDATPTKSDDGGSDAAKSDTAAMLSDALSDTFVVPDAIVDATACGALDPDAATTDQIACCAAQVNATFPIGDAALVIDPDGGVERATEGCCEVVLGAWSMPTDPDAADSGSELGLDRMQVFDCCGIVPNSYERFPAACMAWGPPMPPELFERGTGEVMS